MKKTGKERSADSEQSWLESSGPLSVTDCP